MNALLFSEALAVVNQQSIYLYLQLVAVFSLVILLVERELTFNIPVARIIRRVALIAIVPLLFAFILILMWHVANVQ
jgi:hypothetical protein